MSADNYADGYELGAIHGREDAHKIPNLVFEYGIANRGSSISGRDYDHDFWRGYSQGYREVAYYIINISENGPRWRLEQRA